MTKRITTAETKEIIISDNKLQLIKNGLGIIKTLYDNEGWHLCPCCGSEVQVCMTQHPSLEQTCFHLECTNENCALTYAQNWNYFSIDELKSDWNNNQFVK